MTKKFRTISITLLLTTFAAADSQPATQPGPSEDSRTLAAKTDMGNFNLALNMLEMDIGRYPTTTEGLYALFDAPKGVTNWHGPYLKKKILNDPWNHPYIYLCPGKINPKLFDLFSAGPDGIAGNADDIASP